MVNLNLPLTHLNFFSGFSFSEIDPKVPCPDTQTLRALTLIYLSDLILCCSLAVLASQFAILSPTLDVHFTVLECPLLRLKLLVTPA